MYATIVGPGPDGPLRWGEVDDPPPPGPGQVLLRVHATAVNRADLLQRRGLYDPPPGKSPILGLEAAGVVAAVGDGVTAWAPGDAACALLAGGGYAEQVVCPAAHLLPIPAGLDLVTAAALPEVLLTAYLNLVIEAGMAAGDRVLLHAGASGVGTAAIQVAAAWGASTWVTVGSDDKIARCRAFGADGGTNRHTGDFAADVRAWTGGAGVDIALDPVGGAYLGANQRCLATGGRLVVIGLMGGRNAELDLGRLMVKRQRVVGSVLRSRSDDDKAALVARARAGLWPHVDAGRVVPVVEDVFDVADADAAHARLARNDTVGKLILRLPVAV